MQNRFMSHVFAAAIALSSLAPLTVLAIEPGEALADPALEERARALSKGLRCLVCRNENIDESSAEVARDVRVFLRELLVAGLDDDEAVAQIVNRYGEYVLLNPTAKGGNAILWLAGPGLLIVAFGLSAAYLRGRSRAKEAAPLSDAEQAQIDALLHSADDHPPKSVPRAPDAPDN